MVLFWLWASYLTSWSSISLTYKTELTVLWRMDLMLLDNVERIQHSAWHIMVVTVIIFKCPHPAAAAAAKSLQSCPILRNPIDGSPPGSPIPGILQARTLEWVAISFSNAWKWEVKMKSLSHVRLFATPWTAAYQAPPSMGFSRQEYGSGVQSPSPVHILVPNIF